MPLPPRFESALLNRIPLQEAIELLLLSPTATEVVVGQLTVGSIADHRIPPLRQLHAEPGGGAREKLERAVCRLRQRKPHAGRSHGDRVTNLGLNRNNVRHKNAPCDVESENGMAMHAPSLLATLSTFIQAAVSSRDVGATSSLVADPVTTVGQFRLTLIIFTIEQPGHGVHLHPKADLQHDGPSLRQPSRTLSLRMDEA